MSSVHTAPDAVDFLAVQECCWLMTSSLSITTPGHCCRAPPQPRRPSKAHIALGGGVSPPQLQDLFFLVEFHQVPAGPPLQPVKPGQLCAHRVPPKLMPSENLVRPHSIACSRSLMKMLNRTYLVVHPSRLCCLNMDMWIVWETVSCYKVNDIHTSPHSRLLCAVTRVSRFSFSQTL